MKIIYNAKSMDNPDLCVEKACASWQEAQKRTQIALVAILVAQYHHKDSETTIKRCNTLIEGAKAGNTTAIVEWLDRMGFSMTEDGIQAAPDSDTIVEKAGRGFADAKALHWWDLKPQNPFKGYNLKAAVVELVKKADGMVAKAEKDAALADKIDVDPDMLDALHALAS